MTGCSAETEQALGNPAPKEHRETRQESISVLLLPMCWWECWRAQEGAAPTGAKQHWLPPAPSASPPSLKSIPVWKSSGARSPTASSASTR